MENKTFRGSDSFLFFFFFNVMPGIFATTLADKAFSVTLPQDSTEDECLEYAKL